MELKEAISKHMFSLLEKYNILKEDNWDFIDPATGDAFRVLK